MALLHGARRTPGWRRCWSKLVRLRGRAAAASPCARPSAAEAQAFWEKRRPQGPQVVPRLDTSVRGLQDLRSAACDDLPAIGGQGGAAGRADAVSRSIDARARVRCRCPPAAFAIPVVHCLEHFEASGAAALLRELAGAGPTFAGDPRVRAQAPGRGPRAPSSPTRSTRPCWPRWRARRPRRASAARRFRLRSSSNTEDLPGFSGAGLYTSVSAALGDPERTVGRRPAHGVGQPVGRPRLRRARAGQHRPDARWPWACWSTRPTTASSAPTASPSAATSATPSTPAPDYINAQVGEASVTNPAPGVTSEQLTYAWWKTPPVTYLSRSSLTASAGAAARGDRAHLLLHARRPPPLSAPGSIR